MTFEEEIKFLGNIAFVIKHNPELLNKAIMACTNGMQEALQNETNRAIDMELVAVAFEAMSTNKRYNEKNFHWAQGLAVSKLKKWPEHARINWGKSIEDLEALN